MKTIKWKIAGLALVFSFVLAGCASVAHIEKDPSADFSRYKSYAWLDKAKDDSTKTGDILEATVKSVVNAELQKMTGWRESASKPDLLLSYDVLVERSVREQNEAMYSRPFTRTFYNPRAGRFFNVYYPSQFMGYDNYGVQVQEGTVSVSMIDTRTDKTVWQGWTTEQIDSRKMKSKEVETAVKTIFRKLDLAKK